MEAEQETFDWRNPVHHFQALGGLTLFVLVPLASCAVCVVLTDVDEAVEPLNLYDAQAFPLPLRELGSWLAIERRGQFPQGDEWRDRFGALARQGADLARVVDEWTHWLLSASDSPLARWRGEPYVSATARLYARRLAGDEPATHEWEGAEEVAYWAQFALEDPAAREAAHTASSACLVIMGMDSISNTASIAVAVAVEEAAKRDGNYDQFDAAHAAARTHMANKLAEIIAAK